MTHVTPEAVTYGRQTIHGPAPPPRTVATLFVPAGRLIVGRPFTTCATFCPVPFPGSRTTKIIVLNDPCHAGGGDLREADHSRTCAATPNRRPPLFVPEGRLNVGRPFTTCATFCPVPFPGSRTTKIIVLNDPCHAGGGDLREAGRSRPAQRPPPVPGPSPGSHTPKIIVLNDPCHAGGGDLREAGRSRPPLCPPPPDTQRGGRVPALLSLSTISFAVTAPATRSRSRRCCRR
jgi:hypothetical protein